MTDPGVHRHLPKNLRDTDVVEVRVVAPGEVLVRHRDGTSAVHRFDPAEFGSGDYAAIGQDPSVFATAQIVDGHTLGWVLGNGLVYDLGADGLWLHAHGWCDGSHDLTRYVRRAPR
jgi:hypothetical protein